MRSGKSLSRSNIMAWQQGYSATQGEDTPLFEDANRNSLSRRDPQEGQDKPSFGSSDATAAQSRYESLAAANMQAPPVFFKVISAGRSVRDVNSLLLYLGKQRDVDVERKETAVMETSWGEKLESKESIADVLQSWKSELMPKQVKDHKEMRANLKKVMGMQADLRKAKRSKTGLYKDPDIKSLTNKIKSKASPVLVRHAVMSFPKNLNPEHAMEIARRAAGRELGDRGLEYVIAGHFNEEGHNPHVHVLTRTDLPDGTKFEFDKPIVFRVRHAIAREAREYGVTLHHGMSYERGMYSSTLTQKQLAEGKEHIVMPLPELNRELLQEKLGDVRKQLKLAQKRTGNLDRAVIDQLNKLSIKDDKAIPKDLQLGRDNDRDPGMGNDGI